MVDGILHPLHLAQDAVVAGGAGGVHQPAVHNGREPASAAAAPTGAQKGIVGWGNKTGLGSKAEAGAFRKQTV